MINRFRTLAMNLHQDDSAQDLIEYALIAALIAVACITVMGNLATKIQGTFNAVIAGL